MAKQRTRSQLQAMQLKAVRFAEAVLLDDDKADELDQLSLEQYAERKGVEIIDDRKGNKQMPNPTRADLMERINEVEKENIELQERLDAISELAAAEDEDEEDEDDE